MLAAVREEYAGPETVALRDVERPAVGDEDVSLRYGQPGWIRASGTSRLACRTSSGSLDTGSVNPRPKSSAPISQAGSRLSADTSLASNQVTTCSGGARARSPNTPARMRTG